eukprot:9364791-Alexandrium_andersonii.AAC.1
MRHVALSWRHAARVRTPLRHRTPKSEEQKSPPKTCSNCPGKAATSQTSLAPRWRRRSVRADFCDRWGGAGALPRANSRPRMARPSDRKSRLSH